MLKDSTLQTPEKIPHSRRKFFVRIMVRKPNRAKRKIRKESAMGNNKKQDILGQLRQEIEKNLKEIEQKMRELAKSLFDEKKVEKILGYELGALPMKTRPVFISKPDDVEQLVFNEFCDLNLVKFIPQKSEEKLGVILKYFDIRTLVVLLNEKQLTRDNIVIIGMPCVDLINRHAIEKVLEGKEVESAVITENEIIVKGVDFEQTFKKEDIKFSSCETIGETKPPIYDYLIEDPNPKPSADPSLEFSVVEEFEKKNNRAFDLAEWYAVVAEARHATTHSNGIIKKLRTEGWTSERLKSLETLF